MDRVAPPRVALDRSSEVVPQKRRCALGCVAWPTALVLQCCARHVSQMLELCRLENASATTTRRVESCCKIRGLSWSVRCTIVPTYPQWNDAHSCDILVAISSGRILSTCAVCRLLLGGVARSNRRCMWRQVTSPWKLQNIDSLTSRPAGSSSTTRYGPDLAVRDRHGCQGLLRSAQHGRELDEREKAHVDLQEAQRMNGGREPLMRGREYTTTRPTRRRGKATSDPGNLTATIFDDANWRSPRRYPTRACRRSVVKIRDIYEKISADDMPNYARRQDRWRSSCSTR